MGGYGSGRAPEQVAVEQSLALDTTIWAREGLLRSGTPTSGALNWCDAETGEMATILLYEIDRAGPAWGVRLAYVLPGTNQAREQWVPLQSTTPHLGGVRWWFTCALRTEGGLCFRRCRVLYLPPGREYFGCRHCHQLVYASQREDVVGRIQRRVGKIKKKLGGNPGWAEPFPKRPRGMHRYTYCMLRAQVEQLEHGAERLAIADISRWISSRGA